MTEATRTRLAWTIAIGSLVLDVVSFAMALALEWDTGDWPVAIAVLVATVAWGAIGAVIASRTGNAVGWALLAVIATLAMTLAAQTYATFSYTEASARLPLDLLAAWVGTVTFQLALALIVAIPLLYPAGRARWRWLWRTYLAALASLTVSWALLPQDLSLAIGSVPQPANPIGIEALEEVLGAIVAVSALVILGCTALSILALILGFRGSTGDARQQIRWLAYVGIAAVVALVTLMVFFGVVGDPPPTKLLAWIGNVLAMLFRWIVVLGIPAACGVAILKYRLYDLDLVIRKAVVVTVVAILLVALYLAVLALAAADVAPAWVMAVVVLALTIRPVLRAARAIADRVAYGRRASAYEVLTEFAGHVGETYATDDVLPRMARLLAEGTGASTARVFLRLGPELRPVATWPPDAASSPDEQVTSVVHQGVELGALGVSMPPNDPWDAPRERLANDLASQAGLVLRNVKLIEELKASRQRLVAAQDEERRKIERNIHDGVQQQLVALNVQLGLLAKLAERQPEKAGEIAAGLQGRATEALEDLRDLARGIYPPLLADKGLGAALEAQARKAAVSTTVQADGVGRYPQEVEAAVYFSVLEALNNVAKYAGGSSARVSLAQTDGRLTFRVSDDGRGFDASATSYGTGLQGIADRLDAIGGELAVVSAPGSGTTIEGTVPV